LIVLALAGDSTTTTFILEGGFRAKTGRKLGA
jgi:hypothetical protein